MKKTSIQDFKKYAITPEQMETQKGGIFCEIYVGYTEAQGVPVDPNIMSVAEQLDETLYTEGWWAALQQGANIFISNFG